MTTISPKTKKRIKIGGPTYLKLAKDPKWAKKLSPPPSRAERYFPKKQRRSDSKTRGCSGQEKWMDSNIPERDFCGPEGGACPYTYPVNTPKRARAALAYARHAPNPEGIRKCVRRKARKKGWARNGTIKMKEVDIGGKRHHVTSYPNGDVEVKEA